MLGDFKLKAYFFRTLTYNQITLMFLLYISATLNKYEMLQEVYTYKVSQCLLPVADPEISNRGVPARRADAGSTFTYSVYQN